MSSGGQAVLLQAPLSDRPEWDRVEAALGHVASAMRACPQDPLHHQEGDVWTHTGMVADALLRHGEFWAYPDEDRHALFLAALLHDCGKPETTRYEEDRITSRGHSIRGELIARRLLWEAGVPFVVREKACALVRSHMRPGFLFEQRDMQKEIIRLSVLSRCDLLATLARADTQGRIGSGTEAALERIELFAMAAEELGCLSSPFAFSSAHARFQYFQREDRDPQYAAHDDSRGRMLLMSGIAGSGKDTWIQNNRPEVPVVGLDALRLEHGLSFHGGQAKVVAIAREAAKTYLRKGETFIWNATNLRRDQRDKIIRLAAGYNVRVDAVYVEAPPEILFRQNRSRRSAVPGEAINRMLSNWQVPDLTEVYEVIFALHPLVPGREVAPKPHPRLPRP